MSYLVNPIDNPAAWDFLTIAGVNSLIIKGKLDVKREYKWDVKEGKGTAGATETFVGQPPVKFSVTFYLWQPSDFQTWDNLRNLLKYDPTKAKATPVDIYHPALADIDLHSVVVEKIGAVTFEGQGEYNVTVDFLEYTVPPTTSAVSTPTGSAAQNPPGYTSTVGGTPPDGGQSVKTTTENAANKANNPTASGVAPSG